MTYNVFRLKVKYKIDNQFWYNTIDMSLLNAIKCSIHTEDNVNEITSVLKDVWDCNLTHWNIAYQKCIDILQKEGINNILKELVKTDIKVNHANDIEYSTHKEIMKQLITAHGYKSFTFKINDTTKL